MSLRHASGLVLIVSIFLICFSNCGNEEKSTEERGKVLVSAYCSSCHQPTFAYALDSVTWVDGVLPAMAPKLNLDFKGKDTYALTSASEISLGTWDSIRYYFKHFAPKKLELPSDTLKYIKKGFHFSLIFPTEDLRKQIPTTTLVGINETERSFYMGEAHDDKLYFFDSLQHRRDIVLPSPPVNLYSDVSSNEQKYVTCIGKIRATDEPLGEVVTLNESGNHYVQKQLFGDLRRPLQIKAGDFNHDGLTDYVVGEFGHGSGGLSLFQQNIEKGFKKVLISPLPGAEEIKIGDFDGDGWLDIMCLFAQGREGIWLFRNNQKGGFESQKILEFPPYYGSTGFQLIDFNGDGLLDILYTCGDNADYSQTLKPYHGIYVFLNEGDNKYKQTFFYHMDGCTKAIASDLNKDGILDIVSIAFFADFEKKPQEGFVYLQGKGDLKFQIIENELYKYGRWLTMDVGDFDGDGNYDIILGNYLEGFDFMKKKQQQWFRDVPFVILHNKKL